MMLARPRVCGLVGSLLGCAGTHYTFNSTCRCESEALSCQSRDIFHTFCADHRQYAMNSSVKDRSRHVISVSRFCLRQQFILGGVLHVICSCSFHFTSTFYLFSFCSPTLSHTHISSTSSFASFVDD